MIPPSSESYLLAVDPGQEKLGLAILDANGEVVEKTVVTRDDFSNAFSQMINRYHPSLMAVGDGTGSDWACDVLSAIGLAKIVRVKERNTTLEARELAWKDNPPGLLWKILPRLFWPTPLDLDAWAAVVIGRRALKESNKLD